MHTPDNNSLTRATGGSEQLRTLAPPPRAHQTGAFHHFTVGGLCRARALVQTPHPVPVGIPAFASPEEVAEWGCAPDTRPTEQLYRTAEVKAVLRTGIRPRSFGRLGKMLRRAATADPDPQSDPVGLLYIQMWFHCPHHWAATPKVSAFRGHRLDWCASCLRSTAQLSGSQSFLSPRIIFLKAAVAVRPLRRPG